jgi:hypothetical protein
MRTTRVNRSLDFVRRARVQLTDCARRRIWLSRCGEYRVVESRSLFGLPTVYYAQIQQGGCWDVLSRHRKRGRAERACRAHARAKERAWKMKGSGLNGHLAETAAGL